MVIRSADLNGVELSLFTDDLCRALSILQGRTVSWIYWATFAGGRSLQSALFGGQITKRDSAPALCFNPGRPRFMPDLPLAAQVVVAVKGFRERYDPNHTLIKMWLDSRAEGDFLQARTLKCVVVMEMLTTHTDPVPCRIDKGEWQALYSDRIAPILPPEAVSVLSLQQWKNINRPTFRDKLTAAARQNGIQLQLFGLRDHLPSHALAKAVSDESSTC